MSYPGGKAGAGVYQTIINQMPPHRVYIEPFVGGAAILNRKRPAQVNIACDLDPAAADNIDCPGAEFHRTCAIDYLGRYPFQGDELVYLDPPYVRAVRSTTRDLYKYEMGDIDHVMLIGVIERLPCPVMISGYASDLYDQALSSWRRITFTGQTRGGPREEVLWMNFPEPTTLHDYRYLGRNRRERERIGRKVKRQVERFRRMDTLERRAILSALAAEGVGD